MVGEVAVQVAPTTALRGIDAHERVSLGGDGLAVQGHVAAAAQGCGGVADIHADLLGAPGAELPDVGDRDADGAEAGRRRFADAEWSREQRVGGGGVNSTSSARLACQPATWVSVDNASLLTCGSPEEYPVRPLVYPLRLH